MKHKTTARKTTTAPARVYSYGCSYRGIITGAERANDQYRAAHVYREKLVDLELARRAAVRKILSDATDTNGLGAEVSRLEAAHLAAVTAVKVAKQAARSNRIAVELRTQEIELRQQLKNARERLKEAKRAVAKDPVVQAALTKTLEDYRAAIKVERAASGLYWSTYLIIEKAAEMQRQGTMDPRHRPYTGEGRIAVQLQGGLDVKSLAHDTQLQLVPMAPNRPDLPQPKVQKRHLCRIRIGTENGRAPIWAEIEVFVHRPLPTDARITWAWLQRIRRGRHFIYNLQITLESKTFVAIPSGNRRVALDLGWRVAERGNGGLRVAYWRDSDGAHGEVRLPLKLLAALDYPAQLIGVEENWFEKARTDFAGWLANNTAPSEHTARLLNLAQWRSGRRLASHVWWWKDNRFAGDEQIFAALDEWRVRRFWHYRDWSMAQRDKALACRKDFYRCFAINVLRGCRELVLEDFDLRVFGVKDERVPAAMRYWRMMGAPSELRLCLISAAKKLGVAVLKKDPAMTTRKCNVCGSEARWDQANEVQHTCTCGAVWDQDDNACVNLLASGPVVADSGEALASTETPESEGENTEELTMDDDKEEAA